MTTYGLRSIRFTVCFTAAALLLCAANASAQTTLRWKFKTGQVFEQTITQEIKTSVAVGEKNMEVAVSQVIDATFTIGNVDDKGVADVTQEMKRIRMKLTGMMNGELDSDSAEAPSGPVASLAPAIKSMAKAKFQMKMTPLGEIKEVELSKDAVEGLKSLPNAGQLSNMLSKEGLAEMVKKGAHPMPGGPVKVGDSWTTNMEVGVGAVGKMASQTKLTYAGPEKVGDKPLERINLEVTAKLEKAAAKPAEKAPAQAVPDVTITDQKSQGKLYFDNVAGCLDHSELTQDLTLQVAVAGQKFNQKTQTSTKLQFKPAAAAKK